MSSQPWKNISPAQTAAAVGALGLIAWLRLSNPEGWVRILDDANLVFHEAGHPIYGILGETFGLYGGTLGQLTFPIVFSIRSWFRGETIGFVLALAWLFENFMNISSYMADARDRLLPLVGGGDHDWTNIFANWHVLQHDQVIAQMVNGIGWVGFVACGLWLLYRTFLTRQSL